MRIVGDPGNRWRRATAGSVASMSLMTVPGASSPSVSLSKPRAAAWFGHSSTRVVPLAGASPHGPSGCSRLPLQSGVTRTRTIAAACVAAAALPARAITGRYLDAPSVGDDRLRWVAGGQVPLEGRQPLVEMGQDGDLASNLGPLLGDDVAQLDRNSVAVTRRAQHGQLTSPLERDIERAQTNEQPQSARRRPACSRDSRSRRDPAGAAAPQIRRSVALVVVPAKRATSPIRMPTPKPSSQGNVKALGARRALAPIG